MEEKNSITNITGEIIEIAGKTALSVIPVGGALITAVWDSIKGNAAQKRMDEWKCLIEERLSKLELSLEDIGNNENFTTAMLCASEMAIKTAEKQKRCYLANAVVNAATAELEESVMMIYLDLVGKYTIWHLKILDFFENPKKFPGVNESAYYMGAPSQVLYQVYPELKVNEGLVSKIIKELYADGMLNTDNMNCMMTGNGMVASRTTELGKNFILFLTKESSSRSN